MFKVHLGVGFSAILQWLKPWDASFNLFFGVGMAFLIVAGKFLSHVFFGGGRMDAKKILKKIINVSPPTKKEVEG